MSILLSRNVGPSISSIVAIRNSSKWRLRKSYSSSKFLHTNSNNNFNGNCDDLLNQESIKRSTKLSASTSSSIDHRLRLSESLTANERVRRTLNSLHLDKRRNWRITAAILDSVMNYLDDADQLSADDADFLFRCCGRITSAAPPHKRVLYLRTLWNSLPRLGLEHDLAAYVRLQQMLLQNHQMFSAIGFLERVKKAGYTPNGYLYIGSIIRCTMDDAPDFDQIEYFVEQVKKSTVDYEAWMKTRGAVTSAYAKAKNAEKLKELFDEARAEGERSNNPMALNQYFFSCASVNAQFGDMIGMFREIDNARKINLPMSDYQLLYLVRWLAKGKRQDCVLRVLNYMPKAENWIFRTLPFVLSLVAEGHYVTALTILQRSAIAAASIAPSEVTSSMRQDQSEDANQEILPNLDNIYHFLLDLFYLKLPTTQIQAFCRRFVDCGYTEDAFQLAAVAAFDAKRSDVAHVMLDDIDSRSSPTTAQPIVRSPGKSSADHQARTSKSSPPTSTRSTTMRTLDAKHFSSALRIRSAMGDVDSLLDLLECMESERCSPSIRIWSHYVLRYFRSPTMDARTLFAVFGHIGGRRHLMTAAICASLRERDGRRAREFLQSYPTTQLRIANYEFQNALCDFYQRTYDTQLIVDILKRSNELSREHNIMRKTDKVQDDCATCARAIYEKLSNRLSKEDLQDFVGALDKEGIRVTSDDDLDTQVL